MKRLSVCVLCLAVAALFVWPAIAGQQEQSAGGHEGSAGGHEQSMGDEEQMMPMGPPEEIKAMSHMIGTWEVASSFRMSPEDEQWVEATANCKFEWILDGAAIMMTYSSEMMDMPFHGIGITAYDREKGEYQDVWIDNMGARVSVYTGQMKDDEYVSQGKDYWQGQEFLSRMVMWDISDTSLNWKMEHSMDGGETWVTMGKATYTKVS